MIYMTCVYRGRQEIAVGFIAVRQKVEYQCSMFEHSCSMAAKSFVTLSKNSGNWCVNYIYLLLLIN